ncbi:hypothetical protein [Nocardia alni]|uniref:hypothetical protein n=1 Tax=Nocardia alni TaxID=2815723 RepID=UPI0027E1B3F1|nr:hypothetical protein [Nocardia alni]
MHESSSPVGLSSVARRAILADAAFGARPGIAADELPRAENAAESWLRAVVLGGQGRYAAARAELRRTHRLTADPVLRSLAVSTEASLLRQLGWHARAAALDGRALALAVGAAPIAARGVDHAGHASGADPVALGGLGMPAEAICDALTGLAADALGTARPAVAARLLERCHKYLDAHSEAAVDWRPRLRWHWVCAETALSAPGRGLIAASAATHAATAVEIAERAPSVRHRVKSHLLLAAATAAAGDPGRSAELAALAARQCREYGLLPLRWATAMLRSGVETGAEALSAAAESTACAQELALLGGYFRA